MTVPNRQILFFQINYYLCDSKLYFMNFKNTVACGGTEGGLAVFYVIVILLVILGIAILA